MNRNTSRAVRATAALAIFISGLVAVSAARGTITHGEFSIFEQNWTLTGQPRALKGAPGIYEWRFATKRGPSPFDQIALHRVAAGPRPPGNPVAVVLFLPGTYMNGEIGVDDPRYNLMVYLATKGIDTWALDYRTHFIPPAMPEKDLSELKGWTDELFGSDIDATAAFVSATTHREKLFVSGFSRGVEFGYVYAARHPERVAGLVMLDGFLSDQPPAPGSPKGYAEDVGGQHLTFDKRKVLIQMVIANPDGPAPIPKYKTARENLEHVLYDSAKFGGNGGLANPLGGFSDGPTLARVLLQDDRWWPSIQSYESVPTREQMLSLAGSKVPVIAFASTNLGAAWAGRVQRTALSTGSSDVTFTALQGWGHLDVLCGTEAESKVYAPSAAWIRRHAK